MAEHLLKKSLADKGLGDRVEVRSAGTDAADGDPATPDAIDVMKSYGVDLTHHRAKRLDRKLVEWAEVILVMKADDPSTVVATFPVAESKTLTTLGRFSGLAQEIEDPIGNGRPAYEACARQLQECVQAVIARLLTFGGKR